MSLKEHQKVRIQLAIQYFAIILGIIILISSGVIIQQINSIQRFRVIAEERQQGDFMFFQASPIDPTNRTSRTVYENFNNSIVNIILVDILVSLVGALAAYYYSGKTIEPLIEASETQKRFFSDASHELRTPLAVIQSEAEVIMRSKRQDIERYKDFTASTLEEVQRLNGLTTSILDISKYDTINTDIKLHFEEISLLKIIQISLNRFETQIAGKRIQIEQRHLDKIIFTDKTKFEQLLNIILDNAIKYNKEDGKIEIEWIEDKESAANRNSKTEKGVLVIKDTGVGIPSKDIPHIFDRFYRVSEDRSQKGFGLGLSIAKQISHQLGLKLNISSEEKKFTRVEIGF